MTRGNILSDGAVAELRRIPQTISSEVQRKMQRLYSSNDIQDKQVRIAITLAYNHEYPEGEATQYEVALGRSHFDDEVVGLIDGLEFECYSPNDEDVRVARLLEPTEIAAGTEVLLMLIHEQWYIISDEVLGDTTTTEGVQCSGTCKWIWEDVSSSWNVDSSSCGQSTTTTSTSTTTTEVGSPPVDPVIEYPANCPTTSTSTTTTEAGSPTCDCVPPTFCGYANGDCTFTSCGEAPPEQPYCGPSTSTSTTSSSTTSTEAGCDCDTTTTGGGPDGGPLIPADQGCGWQVDGFGQVIQIDGFCPPGCYCSPPSVAECENMGRTPCICPPEPPPVSIPPPSCYGWHYYRCNQDGLGWTYVPMKHDGCYGDNLDPCTRCQYSPPSAPCNPCESTYVQCGIRKYPCPEDTSTTTTPGGDGTGSGWDSNGPCAHCYKPEPASTSSTSSTTTTTDNCGTTCILKADGPSWTAVKSDCGDACECAPGGGTPRESCDTIEVPCVPTTTTTSTTTTSSTSTSSTSSTSTTTDCGVPSLSDDNQCRWKCDGSSWSLVRDECIPGWECGGVPEHAPNCDTPNTCVEKTCIPTTTTSTTSTTSTTTADCYTGRDNVCEYVCIGAGEGGGNKSWVEQDCRCDPGFTPDTFSMFDCGGNSRGSCATVDCVPTSTTSSTTTTTPPESSTSTTSTTTTCDYRQTWECVDGNCLEKIGYFCGDEPIPDEDDCREDCVPTTTTTSTTTTTTAPESSTTTSTSTTTTVQYGNCCKVGVCFDDPDCEANGGVLAACVNPGAVGCPF